MSKPKRALYFLKNSDLTNVSAIARIGAADLIVAVPSINMAKLREIAPKATVLAYYDMTTIPQYGSASGYYGRQREAMRDFEHRDREGIFYRNAYDNIELQLTFDAYAALAQWINDNTDAGFDGLYLDQCWGVPPEKWIANTGRDRGETHTRWPVVRDYFLKLISTHFLVGNVSARGLPSKFLHGITIEQDGIDSIDDGERFAVQDFVKCNPEYCVLWDGVGYPGLCLTGERLPGR